ncbi:auxin-induced protein 22D-like [Hibiscus syriacus]|uniref:auxin-induced protein 22D-like n=1 Tax=Hibiscus syriacus TaxID=106335 RepID=UPI0019215BCD|nr:auxin-induced protein 22D-like [Hibiscus syriacus]
MYVYDFQSIEDKTRKTANNTSLNLKETELRLGLPGSHPRRKICLFGKDLQINDDKSNGFAVSPFENLAYGAKRGFSDAIKRCLVFLQVQGWPPVRSFRKNTMASDEATADEGHCQYVKMFSCFTMSEYVVTYEDATVIRCLSAMFRGSKNLRPSDVIDSCRRIRITKGTSSKGHVEMQES